jgi:prophage antirepressor-like protein
MSDLDRLGGPPFEFDGLSPDRFGFHAEHGAIVAAAPFIKWLGFSNTDEVIKTHLQPGDLVRGIPLTSGKRSQNVLTKRGVQRLIFRSNKPQAVQYVDRVLDLLDELDRTGMVVDERRITDEQIQQGQQRLSRIAQGRLEERSDYKSILHALKLGGAVADEYRFVQNTLYLSLFGKTAAQIRVSQPQQSGVERKDGKGLVKSNVAKDHLSPQQLKLLGSTVLATIAQIELHHPEGATAAEMTDAIHRAISIIKRPAGAA